MAAIGASVKPIARQPHEHLGEGWLAGV